MHEFSTVVRCEDMNRSKKFNFPSCFSILPAILHCSIRKSLGITLTHYIITIAADVDMDIDTCLHKRIQIHHLRNDSTITESKSDLCAVWTQALFRSLLLVVITIITRWQVADSTVLTSSEPDMRFYVSMETHRI